MASGIRSLCTWCSACGSKPKDNSPDSPPERDDNDTIIEKVPNFVTTQPINQSQLSQPITTNVRKLSPDENVPHSHCSADTRKPLLEIPESIDSVPDEVAPLPPNKREQVTEEGNDVFSPIVYDMPLRTHGMNKGIPANKIDGDAYTITMNTSQNEYKRNVKKNNTINNPPENRNHQTSVHSPMNSHPDLTTNSKQSENDHGDINKMDVKVSFYNDLVDNVSNLPMPHLSFIINLLLPKRLVDNTAADKYFKDVQDVKMGDQLLIRINNMLHRFKNDSQCILVGSNAERFNIPYTSDRTKFFQGKPMSDIDCLLVIEKNMVHSKFSSTSNEKLFTIDNENVHPGYCRLKFTKPIEFNDVKGDLVYIDELQTYYLDGNALQMAIIEEDYNDVGEFFKEINGPAVSFSVQDGQVHFHDAVIAFKLQKWPVEARSFIERQQRQKWLTSDQVRFIEKNGIYLVPVAHKLSPYPNVEWRYSFAEIEVYLANNVITNQARQCFVFLKLIYVQSLKQLDLLSSYHLKTVFLFFCEQLQQNKWNDNIGSCLLCMIDALIECVKNKFLPSFFIRENNLIGHFSDAESNIVLERLMSIRNFPLQPILEFTDTHEVDYCIISSSFKEIILPVLEDMVDFLSHRNINRTVTQAFQPALFKKVNALSLEGKLKAPICDVIDICQMMKKLSPKFTNVADVVEFIIIGLTTNIKA